MAGLGGDADTDRIVYNYLRKRNYDVSLRYYRLNLLDGHAQVCFSTTSRIQLTSFLVMVRSLFPIAITEHCSSTG
jgi:hypothetical protein